MSSRLTALLVTLSLATLPLAAPAADSATAAAEDDKVLYALGALVARNLQSFALSTAEIERVKAGFSDAAAGKPQFDVDAYLPQVQALQKSRGVIVLAHEKEAGKAYQDKAAAEKGATRTASGVIITTLKAGSGGSPDSGDKVKVHYEGALIDGTVFDSSIKRGEPATFPLKGVIPCWTEAVQLMKVGGEARVICPPELAYGDRGQPPKIRGGATLVFDVQLLDIIK